MPSTSLPIKGKMLLKTFWFREAVLHDKVRIKEFRISVSASSSANISAERALSTIGPPAFAGGILRRECQFFVST